MNKGKRGICLNLPLVAQRLKRLPAMQETRVQFLSWEDPLEKEMVTHSSTLAGRSHGERSVMGYGPWGHKELDTTERLHFSCRIQNQYTEITCISIY